MVIYGDCEPFNDYSKFIYPIVPKNKIFTNNSIKKISYEHVKNKIQIFLKKNNF